MAISAELRPGLSLQDGARAALATSALKIMVDHVGIRAIDGLLVHLEDLLKDARVALELGQRGVNSSIVLLVAQGLTSYLRGEKARAAEDWETAAEEVRSRLAWSERSKD